MYLISVVVGRAQPLVWALLFKNEENAHAALGRLREVGDIDVQDEFGQRLCAKGGDIGPILFENMEQSKLATIARSLNEARIRADIVTQVQADPKMRTAAMAQHGPGIISPMGLNGRG